MPRFDTKYGDWFAPDLDVAWRAANAESLELGHSWLGTEHLLLGLLRGASDDPAVQTLSALGVTRDRVAAALAGELGRPRPTEEALLATLGIDLTRVRAHVEANFGRDAVTELYARRRRGGRRLARGPLCGFAMAPRAKLALDRAHRAAKAEHRPRANTTDLLSGLLQVEDGLAVRLLQTLGVDLDALRAQLRLRAAG
ncbi:MAG: hypothetical protein ICV70_05210 [Jiangellaceae bacterium]|nr:hypothetical protein [Jiangellaceae bacterium]